MGIVSSAVCDVCGQTERLRKSSSRAGYPDMWAIVSRSVRIILPDDWWDAENKDEARAEHKQLEDELKDAYPTLTLCSTCVEKTRKKR